MSLVSTLLTPSLAHSLPLLSSQVLTNGFGVADVQTVSGESSGGVTDLLVQQSYVAKSLEGVETVQGSTGRWLLFGRILPANYTATTTTGGASTNGSSVTPVVRHTASAFLLGIDSVREREIGLGRSWTLPPLGLSDLYLSRSIVREIGLDPLTCVGTGVVLRLDLLDVAQTLDVGGISSTSSSSGQSKAQQAEEEARDDSSTPEQTRALLLRSLIQAAVPSMEGRWNETLNFGNDTTLLIAVVDYLNATLALLPDNGGEIQPLPPIVVPEEIEPLLEIINLQYGLNLTPEQLSDFLQSALAGAQVASASAWANNTDAYDAAFDATALIFDPDEVRADLARIRNGTETFGDLLNLFAPFILEMMRIDTPFEIKGVVDEPVRGRERGARGERN